MIDHKALLGRAQSGFLGSLRDALAAAGREDTANVVAEAARSAAPPQLLPAPPAAVSADQATQLVRREQGLPPAGEAVREARAGAPNVPPLARSEVMIDHEDDGTPTTRVVRARPEQRPTPVADGAPRTQLLRGKPKVERGEFGQDPVVGWLVVVGGPGLGNFRPVFEGNNTVGRSPAQRVPIDFGDDAISSEEQAYIRYDSAERAFLFVPNLAKTNIVAVNGKRPTAAVPLAAMDVVMMGRTQLVFVPFCGADFDWSEINDKTS